MDLVVQGNLECQVDPVIQVVRCTCMSTVNQLCTPRSEADSLLRLLLQCLQFLQLGPENVCLQLHFMGTTHCICCLQVVLVGLSHPVALGHLADPVGMFVWLMVVCQ